MKRDPVGDAMRAATGMELFDLAAELLSRIQPLTPAAEKRIHVLQRRLVQERNWLLKPMDRAVAATRNGKWEAGK